MTKDEQFVKLVQTGALAAASKSAFEPGTGAMKAMAAVADAFRVVDAGRLPGDLTAPEAAIQLLKHSGLLGISTDSLPAWLERQ
jgi:hypothetical protein